MVGGASAEPGVTAVIKMLCDLVSHASLCLAGSRRWRAVVRRGITRRVSLTPTAPEAPGCSKFSSCRPDESVRSAPPSARRVGLSSAPARGTGGPRERKLGEEATGGGDDRLDRKWEGLAVPPSTQAGAPRDGGGAGASRALPFLFPRLEPKRIPTSCSPER